MFHIDNYMNAELAIVLVAFFVFIGVRAIAIRASKSTQYQASLSHEYNMEKLRHDPKLITQRREGHSDGE